MPSISEGKRILFISPFFYPEEISTGKYNTYLVSSLVKRGCSVQVVTSYPLYPEWIPKITDLSMKGVDISRSGLGVRYPKNQIFRRIILELWFSYYVVKYLIKQRNKYDLLVAISPPIIFIYFTHILLPKRVTRIVVVHDLQGVMVTSIKKLSRKIIAMVMSIVESKVLSKCDRVICLSKSMRKIIIEKYNIPSERCLVHYPFISTDLAEDKESNMLIDLFDKDHQHIVYSGALGEKQKPEQLAKFFQNLCRHYKELKCHIFSRGPMFDELRMKATLDTEACLLFHDLVPDDLLSELYNCSTVQVIPQAEGVNAGAFPSKLPNLIAHGVPVFAICDKNSELATIVAKMEYGSYVEGWDADNLVEQMARFLVEIEGVSHSNVRKQQEKSLFEMFSINKLVESIVQECNR